MKKIALIKSCVGNYALFNFGAHVFVFFIGHIHTVQSGSHSCCVLVTLYFLSSVLITEITETGMEIFPY